MVFIKRRVIQIANSTQLISLPRKWTKQYSINKGDELEVTEQGNRIIVGTDKVVENNVLDINPPHLKNITERYVTTSFRSGIDEVIVNFSSDNDPGLVEYINKRLDGQTIGYEILSQEKNHFTIKDLSGGDVASYDTTLRRAVILFNTMVQDSFEFIKNKDVNNLRDMYYRDRSINKFTNFCGRILLKTNKFDVRMTAFHYHFSRLFEAIADQYSLMCTYYAEKLTLIHAKVFDCFKETNATVLEYFDLFYKYDKKRINAMFEKVKALETKTMSLLNFPKTDHVVTYYLATIVRRLKELVDSLIEFRVGSQMGRH